MRVALKNWKNSVGYQFSRGSLAVRLLISTQSYRLSPPIPYADAKKSTNTKLPITMRISPPAKPKTYGFQLTADRSRLNEGPEDFATSLASAWRRRRVLFSFGGRSAFGRSSAGSADSRMNTRPYTMPLAPTNAIAAIIPRPMLYA